MSKVSGPGRNRHGIPLYGGDPLRCCWPKCSLSRSPFLKQIPLCDTHSQVVCDQVTKDREQLWAAIEARRIRNGTTGDILPTPLPKGATEPERVEVVYYVQVGGHIKIGWTSRLEQRMRAYPPNTLLLAVHPGSRADEKQLHKRFAVHRSHGNEWYPLVPVILDHIKRVVAEHGEPPESTFGARPVEVPRPHQTKSRLGVAAGVMLRS